MTDFLQFLVSGISLGAIYALVCLGFVVIYRATGVINFAQAGLVVVGAFLTYNASVTWGLKFFGGLAVACVLGALLGILIERVFLRPLGGQPLHDILLVTVGVLLLVEPIVTTIWRPGTTPSSLSTPFHLDPVADWSVRINKLDVASIVIGLLVLSAFFAFFKYTRYGVAMRATAVDREAALMQGINVNVIVAISWGIAGVVAVLGGALLAAGVGPGVGLGVGISIVALKALPAMVLGGLDSAGGAVVGGVLVGVSEVMMTGYQPDIANGTLGRALGMQDWLQSGVAGVLPWVIMLVVLIVRPFGLFGTRQVQRL